MDDHSLWQAFQLDVDSQLRALDRFEGLKATEQVPVSVRLTEKPSEGGEVPTAVLPLHADFYGVLALLTLMGIMPQEPQVRFSVLPINPARLVGTSSPTLTPDVSVSVLEDFSTY